MKHITFGDFIVQPFTTVGTGEISYNVFDSRDSRYVADNLAIKKKAVKIAKRHYRLRKLQKMVKRLIGRK